MPTTALEGAWGGISGESANYPDIQPINTRNEKRNTGWSGLQERLGQELPRWVNSRRAFAGFVLTLMAVAGCGKAEATDEPRLAPPAATASAKTPETQAQPNEWLRDPGEVRGDSAGEVVQSFAKRLQWAMNYPTEVNDQGKSGAEVLRTLFAPTESGNAYYAYFADLAQQIQAQRGPQIDPRTRLDRDMHRTVKLTPLNEPLILETQLPPQTAAERAPFDQVRVFSYDLALDMNNWMYGAITPHQPAEQGEPLKAEFSFTKYEDGWRVAKIDGKDYVN